MCIRDRSLGVLLYGRLQILPVSPVTSIPWSLCYPHVYIIHYLQSSSLFFSASIVSYRTNSVQFSFPFCMTLRSVLNTLILLREWSFLSLFLFMNVPPNLLFQCIETFYTNIKYFTFLKSSSSMDHVKNVVYNDVWLLLQWVSSALCAHLPVLWCDILRGDILSIYLYLSTCCLHLFDICTSVSFTLHISCFYFSFIQSHSYSFQPIF